MGDHYVQFFSESSQSASALKSKQKRTPKMGLNVKERRKSKWRCSMTEHFFFSDSTLRYPSLPCFHSNCPSQDTESIMKSWIIIAIFVCLLVMSYHHIFLNDSWPFTDAPLVEGKWHSPEDRNSRRWRWRWWHSRIHSHRATRVCPTTRQWDFSAAIAYLRSIPSHLQHLWRRRGGQ